MNVHAVHELLERLSNLLRAEERGPLRELLAAFATLPRTKGVLC